jgi:hypothetical protein
MAAMDDINPTSFVYPLSEEVILLTNDLPLDDATTLPYFVTTPQADSPNRISRIPPTQLPPSSKD